MIGIDIVVISRISKLKKRYGEAFAKRFLSEDEIKIAKNDATMAGFYAAKEAVSKALGCGISSECSFFDIEIYKTEKNAPKIKLSDKLKQNFKISEADISISHDGGFAIAAVILK
ncbi:holo-ACP synthase [Campylobacter sp. RM16192]|uniref:holo-ACP synthase n=1 Tax=Campylobacter sp. RM16192 TaxID=1660080 RepID=UPI0014517AEA|nr:holo-ACP synthase [Campylobacter sp. RM16192]QCD52746.1 holo-(acyl-carrier-protein) synthase [Campylobacter sp. RM16192]